MDHRVRVISDEHGGPVTVDVDGRGSVEMTREEAESLRDALLASVGEPRYVRDLCTKLEQAHEIASQQAEVAREEIEAKLAAMNRAERAERHAEAAEKQVEELRGQRHDDGCGSGMVGMQDEIDHLRAERDATLAKLARVREMCEGKVAEFGGIASEYNAILAILDGDAHG